MSEHAAWTSMAQGLAALLGAGTHARTRVDGVSAVAFTGTDCTDLNMAMAWESPSAATLDAIRAWSGPMLALAGDGAYRAVADIASDLALTDIDAALPVWAVGLDALSPAPERPGGPTTVVESAHDLHRARAIIAQSYGLDPALVDAAFPDAVRSAPGITWYLGWSQGEATSTVALARVGEDVSAWCGATVPEARGQGLFNALVLASAGHQAQRGARRYLGITEAVASGRTAERFGGTIVDHAHVFLRGTSVGELLQA